MPKGGYRPGSGRKAGTANKKTRAIANEVNKSGLTPLEVMLKAMRAADAEGNAKEAAAYANMAAPYVHPRLSSVNSRSEVQASLVVFDEFGDSYELN